MSQPRRICKLDLLAYSTQLKTFKWDLIPRFEKAHAFTKAQVYVWHEFQRCTAHGTRYTFMSRKKLAALTGFSESTCWRAMKKLEELGLLIKVWVSRGGTKNANGWLSLHRIPAITRKILAKLSSFFQNCIKIQTPIPNPITILEVKEVADEHWFEKNKAYLSRLLRSPG